MEINLNKPVIREAVIRALTPENIKNREAEFVISTEAVDAHETVFKIAGWDLKRYQTNPIVCYQHKSNSDNPDMILGTSEVRIEGNQLIGLVRFESAEINPVAEKVWQKIQAGTLRMASVGANPTSGHWGDAIAGEDPEIIYFDGAELVEWSIVSIGSNPEALKRSTKNMDEIRSTIIKNKPVEVIQPDENRELNAFDAQIIINSNL